MKKLLILLAVPTIAFGALKKTPEKDCTPIDLRNETLGEVRNQKKVSWCYAFAASDMLGHTFQSQEKMSAADIAIGYNGTKIARLVRWFDANLINRRDQEIQMMAHQTGFNKVALDRAMSNGWCPESVFPSESWVKSTRTASGKSAWNNEQVDLRVAMLEIAELHKKRQTLTAENVPFYYSFKNVDAAQFVKLLKNKKLPDFYAGLRQTVCRDDRQPFDRRWKVKMEIKNPKVFSRINAHLNSGRLVGLDYDGTILEDSNYRRMKLGELHTSALVGRRWDPERKSCEFLIRNSYGTECGARYDASYKCEDGNIWLDESLIYPTMTSIVYMLSPPN